MDSIGEFLEMESNGKLFLVYYHPISQTQSPTSFVEATSHHQPLFLCPLSRCLGGSRSTTFPITSSPEYTICTKQEETTKEEKYHSVLPLFWCNNKEFDDHGRCYICRDSNYGTDYYLCINCDLMFHRECVQSPTKIKHPYHPEHSLKLYYSKQNSKCLCCGRGAWDLVYKCTICDAVMHPICAMKLIPSIVDQPKTHDHSLSFFPRQTFLTCNVCGLLRKNKPTYICARCNFVAHKDCMCSPRIIKISRHHHRISYRSSLQSGKWSCGVCRQSINESYGAYACKKCGDYAVHTRCALEKDVCDGEDLEGVPEEEEDGITQDPGPFIMISEGVMLHFLHDHHLRLKVSVLYDENMLCQTCVLPIYEGNHYYSCMQCDFVIHETCASDRRRIQHALHPHPLTLDIVSKDVPGYFFCDACHRICCGFVYMCPRKGCNSFSLDVSCASISEPIHYEGHEQHPMFLAYSGSDKALICQMCESRYNIPLNCIECDFSVCMKCATLPYKARYKCDKHLLKVSWRKEVREKDWCEGCERNLGHTDTKMFYRCNECSTTLHIECIFGKDLYLKPGKVLVDDGEEVQILCKNPVSRPLCENCKNPCQGKVLKNGNLTLCSMECVFNFEM